MKLYTIVRFGSVGLSVIATLGMIAASQDVSPTSAPTSEATPSKETQAAENDRVIAEAVRQLLAMQEGDDKAEWPYEGVYRVGGKIPIGYRVGGTAIVSMALMRASGYAEDAARREAVARATTFVIKSIEHPLMTPDYEGGYDVRGWGYTFGLTFLLQLKAMNAQPADMAASIDETIQFFVNSIMQTEIHQVGGWNYARGQGKETVSPPAPFMTAPTLQALFEARRQGFNVDESVVNRALDTLAQSRTPTGSVRYSGVNGEKSRESVPGSVGRMLVSESTLFLAGRTTAANVRGALDAFLVHWQWLDKRRAQTGTHVAPYGIAPYYFYFAHYYAAQAIELLPKHEQEEYRRRLRELIMSVRLPDGTWNDRVFPRSANFGSAMCILALTAPAAQPPTTWEAKRDEPKADSAHKADSAQQ